MGGSVGIIITDVFVGTIGAVVEVGLGVGGKEKDVPVTVGRGPIILGVKVGRKVGVGLGVRVTVGVAVGRIGVRVGVSEAV